MRKFLCITLIILVTSSVGAQESNWYIKRTVPVPPKEIIIESRILPLYEADFNTDKLKVDLADPVAISVSLTPAGISASFTFHYTISYDGRPVLCRYFKTKEITLMNDCGIDIETSLSVEELFPKEQSPVSPPVQKKKTFTT